MRAGLWWLCPSARGRDVAPLTHGAVAIALDSEASVGKPLGWSGRMLCRPWRMRH